MVAAEDADPRGKRDPRDFALWKGHKPTSLRRRRGPLRGVAAARAGTSSARRWLGKYLGREFDIHGGGIDLRFPHHENELAQSRAAGHRFARWWMHNAWITASGEKMSKSLSNALLVSEVVKRVRPIELRYYLVSSHYRSHVEFSFEALEEAAWRSGGSRTSSTGPPNASVSWPPPTSCPTASSRRWTTTWAPRPRWRCCTTRCARATGSHRRRRRRGCASLVGSVRGMLAFSGSTRRTGLGERRSRPTSGSRRRRRPGAGLLEQRAKRLGPARTSPPRTLSATSSRTPGSMSRTPHKDRVDGAGTLMPGNASGKGAIRKTQGGNPTAGSGGRRRKASRVTARPQGEGPTAKATRSTRSGRSASESARPSPGVDAAASTEWVAGRNSVVEALQAGIPVTTLYVADRRRARRPTTRCVPDRRRPGLSMLEVSRNELDKMTDRAVHQGLATKIPAYDYADPHDLLDRPRSCRRACR